MGKIEILEDYNKPFTFQGKDYLLNYDPDTYAVEAVEKYWSDKILPLSVEIQGTSHDWGNDITKEEAEELAKEKVYCPEELKAYDKNAHKADTDAKATLAVFRAQIEKEKSKVDDYDYNR